MLFTSYNCLKKCVQGGVTQCWTLIHISYICTLLGYNLKVYCKVLMLLLYIFIKHSQIFCQLISVLFIHKLLGKSGSIDQAAPDPEGSKNWTEIYGINCTYTVYTVHTVQYIYCTVLYWRIFSRKYVCLLLWLQSFWINTNYIFIFIFNI